MGNSNWDRVSLEDVCRVEAGAGFPIVYQGLRDREFPFFKVGDMNTAGNEREMCVHEHSISEETRKKLRAIAFPAGTIVFPKIGAAIATNKKRILVKPSCVDNNVMALIPKEELDSNFLYYLLQNKDLSDFANTGNPPSIRQTTIEEWVIPLPPLTEQKRIASLLARADRLRSLRRTVRDLGDSLLQSVFLEMFGETKTNSKNWDMCIIDDVVRFSQYGTSEKSNSEKRGYPVLGMANITYEGKIDLGKLSYVELSEKEFADLKLERGDIIFNRTNSTELVGKTAFWTYDFDAVIASYLVKLKLKKDVLPEFFVGLLNTPYFKSIFQERCKKAVGQSNVSPTLLKEFPMFVPPLNLQEEFASVVARVEQMRARQAEGGGRSKGCLRRCWVRRSSNSPLPSSPDCRTARKSGEVNVKLE